jgi:hypothetical protein
VLLGAMHPSSRELCRETVLAYKVLLSSGARAGAVPQSSVPQSCACILWGDSCEDASCELR